MSGVRNAVLVLLLLVAAGAAYLWGPRLVRRFTGGGSDAPEQVMVPSQELADSTLTRLETFQNRDVFRGVVGGGHVYNSLFALKPMPRGLWGWPGPDNIRKLQMRWKARSREATTIRR